MQSDWIFSSCPILLEQMTGSGPANACLGGKCLAAWTEPLDSPFFDWEAFVQNGKASALGKKPLLYMVRKRSSSSSIAGRLSPAGFVVHPPHRNRLYIWRTAFVQNPLSVFCGRKSAAGTRCKRACFKLKGRSTRSALSIALPYLAFPCHTLPHLAVPNFARFLLSSPCSCNLAMEQRKEVKLTLHPKNEKSITNRGKWRPCNVN